MARIGIPGKSRKNKNDNKNVLKTRPPKNSSNYGYSNNYRNSRNSRGSKNSKNSRNSLYSNNSRGSIWSKNSGPKKPRSTKQMLLMIIILFAFICGLALGISMIMGIGEDNSPDSGHVEYMNVTNNITVYENSSYDLQDENGTQISYYDFDENVSEGQNITAFNASNSANIF